MGIWFLHGVWLLGAVAGFIALRIAFRIIKSGKRIFKIIALLFLGAAVGGIWMFSYDQIYIDPARQLAGASRTLTIQVTDYSTENARGTGGKGKVNINGKSYTVYYYLSQSDSLKPGDRIKGTFKFSFTGFGGEGDPTYHQGNGIFLLAQGADQVQICRVEKVLARYFPVKLRNKIIGKIDSIFSEDVSGFARSLLLGDTSKLSIEDDTSLKISGIRHVVAVSGLHISILMSCIFIFVRTRRFINSIVSIPLLLLFTALAGFTPSVLRACIMQIVFVISLEAEKEYDAPTALSLAVFLLILINPLVITSISFQLSVSCVIGILLFSGRIYNLLLRTKLGPAKGKSLKSKLIRGGALSVSVTLSTMATTLPINAYYFGSVCLVSVLSNFLLLGLVTFCFYGIAFSCLAAFIFPVFGSLLGMIFSWPIRGVLYAAKLLSKIPFAAVSSENLYVLLWVIFIYGLFVVFLLNKKKKPFLFCGLSVLGLCISLSLACLEPRMDNYRVTVLDVGQGQCILIQSKDSCYMVDCGGFSDYAVADLAALTLRTEGISKIDGLILTHFDQDHAGNAESFLRQIRAEHIYIPAADIDHPIRRDLEYEYSGVLRNVRKTTILNCGVGQITIYPGEKGKEGNESSLCILFQAKDCDILITGDRNSDGERYLIDHEELPYIDVLIAGHHGAKSSTSLYLLQQLQPKTVVISVGEDNYYGHPDPVIIKRLENFACTIWRTDQDGTVVFRG